jgi:N-acetylglucosaminyldiphosphoundecaprenol N-acetyl-beta-D-mannosaminyltransferase
LNETLQATFQTANILGVRVALLALPEVLEYIQRATQGDGRTLITHVHVMGLNLAYEQAWLRQFINQSNLVYADGMGVKVGGALLGYRIPQRFTLADWIWPLAEIAETGSLALFLLGNPPGAAERAADRLRERFPNLKIAGAYHGFFDKTPGSLENEQVVTQINATRPDILLVGFGMPAQERWLMENWPRLDARLAITCGALFEYLAGDLQRGPAWMTQHYLEWLARLLISPRRYWRRYLRDNPLFLYRILKQRFNIGTIE